MESWELGSIFGASSVMLGAFGAHWLKGFLKADIAMARKLSAWDTAVKYQMFHSLALLAFSLRRNGSKSSSSNAPFLFTSGILLFSGSIYLLTLLPAKYNMLRKVLGPITPIGGFLLIGGWFSLFAMK